MSYRNLPLRLSLVFAVGLLAIFTHAGCQSPVPVVTPEKQAIVINVDDSEAIIPASQLDSTLHKKVQVIDRQSGRKSWLTPAEFKSVPAGQRYLLVQPPAGDS